MKRLGKPEFLADKLQPNMCRPTLAESAAYQHPALQLNIFIQFFFAFLSCVIYNFIIHNLYFFV